MAIQTVTVKINNGQAIPLTLQQNGKYEATLTAPSESSNSTALGYFDVRIDATDTAGNSAYIDSSDTAFGDDLKLYTVEQNDPTVDISYPTAGDFSGSATPTFSFTATDISQAQQTGYSGFDLNSSWLTITLDNTAYTGNGLSTILSGITVTPTSGTANAAGYYGGVGYSASFKTLADGQHTVVVTVTDKDGNTGSASRTFTVDTVKPELTNVAINTNTDSSFETNTRTLVVTGTATDLTGGVASVAITLNGVDQGTVTLGSGGAFEKTLTVSSDGTYTIVISATDTANNTRTVTRTVTVDTAVPQFTWVEINSQTGNAGRTYTISVSVS